MSIDKKKLGYVLLDTTISYWKVGWVFDRYWKI